MLSLKRSLVGHLVIAALSLPLASCANPLAQEAVYAQTALVGMPRALLLSCAGVPARSAQQNDLEFFTYSSQRLEGYPGGVGFGGFSGGRRGGVGLGFGVPFGGYSGYASTESCEATFTLRNGVVERIVYGGADSLGTSRLAQCYRIIQNCTQEIPNRLPPARAY